MGFTEADWKIFRRLHAIALERYCQRVLEEVRIAAECQENFHECYRNVYRLIRNRDKTLAAAFDDLSRSNAILLLANIISEGLLSEEELLQFSDETQERITTIKEIRPEYVD